MRKCVERGSRRVEEMDTVLRAATPLSNAEAK